MVARTASARYAVRLPLFGYSSISWTNRNRYRPPWPVAAAPPAPGATAVSAAMATPPLLSAGDPPRSRFDRSAPGRPPVPLPGPGRWIGGRVRRGAPASGVEHGGGDQF